MAITLPKMGLKVWNLLSDLFDHDQLADNFAKLDMHDHTPGRGTQIPTEGIADGAITSPKLAPGALSIADSSITTSKYAPGSVTGDVLASSLDDVLGVNSASVVRRGKSIISAAETRTNTAYGTLTTPDQVTVVLPSGGKIFVAYQAAWQESVASAGRAAIFIGANQLQVQHVSNGPRNSEAIVAGAPVTGVYQPLGSHSLGLASGVGFTPDDTTTGQAVGMFSDGSLANGTGGTGAISYSVGGFTAVLGAIGSTGGGSGGLGGPCEIFADPGTYTVSVQFKATSGNVTVKNRKLWVWTIGF